MAWLELGDATRFLGELIGTSISRDDLFRLALDGYLTLSVRFVSPVNVLPGRVVPREEAEWRQTPLLDGEGFFLTCNGTPLPDGQGVIVYEDRIAKIADVWDLPMIGGERLFVENLYETTLFRDPPELFNLEGTFVTNSTGGYAQLMERYEGELGKRRKNQPYHPDHYFPAATLPEDAVIVARTQALRDFAERLNGKAAAADEQPSSPIADRPLATRERATLLTMIAALARLAKLDLSKPSSAAAAI